MSRTPLLYFASVFWDDPQITPQQIARRLADRYDVLYVEPSPRSVYLREPANNVRWLRAGRSLRQVAEGLHVYSPPPMLPLKTRLPSFNVISHAFIRPFVRRVWRSLGYGPPVLFAYLPHVYTAVGRYGERLVCYYCIDNMGALDGVIDPGIVAGYERRLVDQSDLVFTTSRGLRERLAAFHRDVTVVPNGSDPDLYAEALHEDTVVAEPLRGIAGPVLGFSGLVDFRLDQALVAEVARRRPDWTFVFVGPVRTSVAALTSFGNVRFVPSQPQSALPSFFKGFSVALIPYTLGPMVQFIYPTKLNDYLGAGVPVVSTGLPELDGFSDAIVTRVRGADAFIGAVERALPLRHDRAAVAARVAFARENSWQARADVIATRLDACLAERRCGS